MNALATSLHSFLLLVLLLALPAFVATRIAESRPAPTGVDVAMQAGLPVGTMPAFDIEAVPASVPVAFEVAADYEIVVTAPPLDVRS